MNINTLITPCYGDLKDIQKVRVQVSATYNFIHYVLSPTSGKSSLYKE